MPDFSSLGGAGAGDDGDDDGEDDMPALEEADPESTTPETGVADAKGKGKA